ncbi:ECF transporter S component [Clostridium sp. 19966]|uniref:ECF transporter S component n=1 Tax=Clostridium sp. 19966 TaxID=2768166 RepID=UPI0028DE3C9B|nr:ECF transporter S component [Clostridium sp. 19966]MDT8715565.1 ECF transporter S component [Clostridium sp. 19966]
MKSVNKSTEMLVKIALLSAIAVVLMVFEFPILPAFPFLKIDLSDLPAVIGAFGFGPMVGIVIELIKNILIILVKGTGTAGVGELANFIVGASYVGMAGLIYKKNKTKTGAVISLAAATIAMTIVGVLANYYILVPLYKLQLQGADYITKYIVSGIVPFNLIKGIMVSAITMLAYNKISIVIRAEGFKSKNAA